MAGVSNAGPTPFFGVKTISPLDVDSSTHLEPALCHCPRDLPQVISRGHPGRMRIRYRYTRSPASGP